MNKIQVVVVDDHQIIRDGIRALLTGADNIEIIAEAGSAEELLLKIPQSHVDVALIDISLPGISGIKLTEQLTLSSPDLKVLILSMHLNEEYISSAIKAGAMGYLAKNTTRDELISAINEVAQGNRYLGKDVSERITSGFISRARVSNTAEKEPLSKRELQILKLTAEGHGNKEISEKLFISIRTVESHKTHIMQKLELKSAVEMTRYAIKHGLVNI
jgi:DNA-binding NarL/FixJ family response regulator